MHWPSSILVVSFLSTDVLIWPQVTSSCSRLRGGFGITNHLGAVGEIRIHEFAGSKKHGHVDGNIWESCVTFAGLHFSCRCFSTGPRCHPTDPGRWGTSNDRKLVIYCQICQKFCHFAGCIPLFASSNHSQSCSNFASYTSEFPYAHFYTCK